MKRRAALTVLAAALAASSAGHALAQASVMRIFDAAYGDSATHRLCDATAAVAALCDGKSACVIPVGNELCGDPAFGTGKKLHLAFKCLGSVPQLLIAAEPGTVRLTCAAAATGPRT